MISPDIGAIQFRQYERRDDPQVLALHTQGVRPNNPFSHTPGWDSDIYDIPRHYLGKGGDFLVGLLGIDTIVTIGGFRPLEGEPTTAEIKRMRVASGLQGLGAGSRHLAKLEQSAADRGFREGYLDTPVDLVQARHFYGKNGWTEEVERVDSGLASELVVFRKNLVRPH